MNLNNDIENLNDQFMHCIDDETFGIGSVHLEDYRSVISARCARNKNLDQIFHGAENIEQFLRKNLGGYGHASIGDLGYSTIYLKNINWLQTQTMFAEPLMNGQELSTRAVSNLGVQAKMLSNMFDESFKFFSAMVYREEILVSEKKHYYLDEIRFLLPGTYGTNAVWSGSNRTICRHLDKIANISFMKDIVNRCDAVLKLLAPVSWEVLRQHKLRSIPHTLQYIQLCSLDKDISISSLQILSHEEMCNFLELNPRMTDKDMINENIAQFGLFKVKIQCTIAGARDFLRHRTAHTWQKRLIVNDMKQSIISPYINEIHREQMQNFINQYTFEENDNLEKILLLPLGSMIEIEGYFTLDKIIYLLELRAYATGAHKEYQQIALHGIKQLIDILGNEIAQLLKLTR